jgi:hypothetical protein
MESGASIGLGDARKVAFMDDMIADQVTHGLTRMESAFVQITPPSRPKRAFEICSSIAVGRSTRSTKELRSDCQEADAKVVLRSDNPNRA